MHTDKIVELAETCSSVSRDPDFHIKEFHFTHSGLLLFVVKLEKELNARETAHIDTVNEAIINALNEERN